MFYFLRYSLFSLLVLVAMLGYGQAPAISSFSPVSGPVGTLVTINGTNLNSPTAFTIGGQSAIVVSNTDSVLVGMVMPGAVTGAVSITTGGGIANGTGNFTITATKYPSVQQGSKLVGTGAIGIAGQGISVALSADGNTAIVGGFQDNDDPSGDPGAAWIYTRVGATWNQQGSKLIGSGSAGDAWQGWSVYLSADGNTAIVGGYKDNSGLGAAWVYARNGDTWTQQGSKLVGTGNTGAAEQGYSVSLSADGNTAIIGGPNDNPNGNSYEGAAWVFTRSSGVWTQQGAKLVGPDNIGPAEQGWSVSVSADGNTAMVGGEGDNSGQGAAWVYVRSGGTWTQQGSKLVGTGNTGNAGQGYSVCLSADGNTAAVGGPIDNSSAGAAWVFTRSGGAWTQQGSKLVGTGSTGSPVFQGTAVSLSADGNTAIVGGNSDNNLQGAAWIYTRNSGTWVQQAPKLVGTGSTGESHQGTSVSLSADGNTAMVGGDYDNSGQGATWVYVAVPPTITSFSPAAGPPGTLVTINGTNLNNPTAFTIGGQSAIVVSNTGNTLVAMVMPGATTGGVSISTAGGTASGGSNFTITATNIPSAQQGSKLVGIGNIGFAEQGQAVSLSADGNTAIVGGFNDNSNASGNVGAAWIYTRSGGIWSQQGPKLVGTGSAGDADQGWSVSLSADGNTAIVGGYLDNNNQGAVWVFIRSGGAWSQQGPKLVGTGNTGPAEQGWRVSLSADGNTALIGGPNDNTNQGAAWIFTRSGSNWTQQGSKLVGTDNTGNADQGESVSLSADGNTAIVGGPDLSNQGAVWIYTRSGNTWSQQGPKLAGTGGTGPAGIGYAVSLSADGNTAIVGGGDSSGGAVWIYTRSGGTWAQQGSKLVGTGSVGMSAEGASVSLSADGNTALIGGPNDNTYQGATWIFSRSGSTWTQYGSKLIGMGSIGQTQEGVSVSLSADGNTAIVGGEVDNSYQGAAWVYNTLSNASLTTIALTPASTLTNTGTTGSTTTYTTSVSNTVTSVTVTPTTNAPTATIAVNGAAVTSGTASANIPLDVGANTINTVVTAQDGVTTQTYKIIVGRGASNAYLTHLSISSGTLKPVTGSPNYTVSVTNATTSVTVTPTTADPNATVTVNGTAVTSGTASTAIPLSIGTNAINIIVTAQDGVTTQPYVITVTRAGSSDAYLSHLAISSGTLTPVTGSPNYTVNVTNAITSVTVTPTTADPTATVTVNGTAVTSGTASGAIPLNVGANAIDIVVTAQDDVTTQPYVITVTRAEQVLAAPVITYTTPEVYIVGVPIAPLPPFNSGGAPGSYSISGLPAGLLISPTTGLISGTPTAVTAATNYTVTATNTAGNATFNINITIVPLPPVISYTTPDVFPVGVAIIPLTPVSSGSAPTSYSISGVLPPGLTFNTTNGVISGTPTTASPTTTFTITATNTDGTGSTAVNISTIILSDNALLSSIKLTPASVLTNTGTVGTTTTYTTSVSNATTSVTVTPTTADPTATVKVNGTTVTSGTASASIPLAVGANMITTIVTAQDGVTTQTCTIIVGRGASVDYLSHLAISSGTLKPVTGSPNYTDAVTNATTSVTVTPTTTDPNATVTVNGTTVTSGTASAAIPLNVGANAINIVVTAQDGVTTQPYVITVTRAPSSNAYLSHLAISSGALKPVTGSPNYTDAVTNATTSVTVTATTTDPNATLKINGTVVISGTASAAILLNVGANAINIVVTAQDGVTTQPYVITVTRAPSNNAYLSHISISSGTLKPVTGSPNYTDAVTNATTSVTVTPTTTDPNATVTVNGASVTSGTASAAIPLTVGANAINIVVTAQDGTTTQPYVITVTRAPSSNAYLSHLAISSGTLTPVTGSPNYTASVTNATKSVTVTATTADPTATLKINGTSVMSGTPSAAIALVVGSNTINIVVTAQDGVTTQPYVITVTRATGPLMSLYLPISVVQPADNVPIENDGVMVHQGVSPNGDGINDVLTIDGITAYPDNKLMIIDRSGAIIFEAKGYNNIGKVFDGHSIDGRMQQPGTYFYSLDYVADGQNKHKTGYIILKY